jgi:hypothetical protein
MRLALHPKVYSDIDGIMGYYERVATPGLAEEFYTELRYFMTKAADKPKLLQTAASLRTFFVFAISAEALKSLVAFLGYRSSPELINI